MMSAYTDEATIDRSRAAGAWLFLPKPVPLPTLVEAFESLAQRPAAALVVEDEVNLAENLAEALTAAGHEVVVSHTAADALAHRRRLQTAVLDYRLPDASGLEIARQLRARDPSIQILFISGYADGLQEEIKRDSGRGRHAGEAARHGQRRLLGPARRQTFVGPLRSTGRQISRSARTTPPSASPIVNPSRAQRRCIRMFASRMSA